MVSFCHQHAANARRSLSQALRTVNALPVKSATHFWGGNHLAGHHGGGGWNCRNSELETSKLERRSRRRAQTAASSTPALAAGWNRALTVASRWVAAALWYNRSNMLREERCQGGVAGGVPPHKGGPKARPYKRQWPVVSGQELQEAAMAPFLPEVWDSVPLSWTTRPVKAKRPTRYLLIDRIRADGWDLDRSLSQYILCRAAW